MNSTASFDSTALAILRFLRENNISTTSRILLAVSGGLDSMVMLSLFSRIWEGDREVIHINHGLRPASEHQAEADLVREYSRSLGLNCRMKAIEPGRIGAEAQKSREGIEAAARNLRYGFFESEAVAGGFDYVFTAHTLDDQDELTLMRFFRGASFHGLRGMLPVRGRFVRPLLQFRKVFLGELASKYSIPYLEDSSNREDVYLRNNVRRNLIPVIHHIFPGYGKSLERFRMFVNEHDSLVTGILDSLLEKHPRTDTGISLPWEEFLKLPGVIRVGLLRRIMGSDLIVPETFFRPVYLLDETGCDILLNGYGWILKRSGDLVHWSFCVVSNRKKGYLIHASPESWVQLPGNDRIGLALSEFEDFTGELLFGFQSSGHIVFRSSVTGDRIHSGGMTKLVSKVFNGLGIPSHERWKVPLVEDTFGIRAILGSPFGYGNVFSDSSGENDGKIMRIFTGNGD